MTLEKEAIEISLSRLKPSGWEAGSAYDRDADQELMEEDMKEAIIREERNKRTGFFGCEK